MKLFQKMSNNRARCLLCPRYCEIDDGCNGRCYGRWNRNGEIVSSGFGVVSSIAVEPIEKKPFKHFMPGTKTLSIGGYGCNLECRYCENEEISRASARFHSKNFTPQDIIDKAKEKDCPSVCMTYNEPTIAFEYLIKLANLCHENDLKFIIKTNAYINEEPWKEVCEVVDAMNIDYKGFGHYFEDVTECRYIPNYFNKIYIALWKKVHVELSIPIFSGIDTTDYFDLFWNLKAINHDLEIPCHLLKVNPAHLMINERVTSDEEIEKARKKLSDIFSKIYV